MHAFAFAPDVLAEYSDETISLNAPPLLPSQLIWASGTVEPVAARVAIAADFFPPRQLPSTAAWAEMAARIAPYFTDVDTTFLNFDAALAPDVPHPSPDLAAVPAEALACLAQMKVRAVGFAHDHACDAAPSPLASTKELFLRHGMVPLGTGKTLRKAPAAWVWQGPGGIRVGFWAAARGSICGATRNLPGVEPATLDRALYALECLRYHQAQCCIALLNLGPPDSLDPRWSETDLMDSFSKWGFDIVCASHSAFLRGARCVEGYRGNPAFTFHGLGNVVSDAASADSQGEGLIVVAGLDMQGALIQLELRPVLLNAEGFATVPDRASSDAIFARFARLSRALESSPMERMLARATSPRLIEFQSPRRVTAPKNLQRSGGMVRVRQLVEKLIG